MLSVGAAYGIILGCTAVGLVYGVINWLRVKAVDLTAFGSQGGADTPLSQGGDDIDKSRVDTMLQIGEYISNVSSFIASSFSANNAFFEFRVQVPSLPESTSMSESLSWASCSLSG